MFWYQWQFEWVNPKKELFSSEVSPITPDHKKASSDAFLCFGVIGDTSEENSSFLGFTNVNCHWYQNKVQRYC